MAITSTGGRDPELIIPIGASDAFSKTFKDFKSKGLSAAAKVSSGFGKAGGAMKKSFKAVSAAGGAAAKALIKAFLAVGAAIVFADKKANDFEESLISLGRVTKQPQEEIRRRMLELPPILGNLTDLTKGYYQVISAGVTEPIKAIETLTQASKIAKITHVEQGEVVKGLTKLMAGYGGEIKNVSQASDILFTIEKLGQTSVGELIPVIGGLSKSAKDLSINTYEMGAAFAQISQFAGNTEEAATQLRAVFTALLKPSELLKTALSKAGIESVTLSIKQRGLLETLQLVKAAAGGTDESFRRLFTNVRAGSGAAAIASGNFAGFEQRITGMEDGIGAASKAWDDWAKSGAAATQRLKSNLDNFFIKLGEKAGLTDLKNGVSSFLENQGNQFINFLTNIPEIASLSFKLLLDLYLKFVSDRMFRKELVSSAVESFGKILNAGLNMYSSLYKAAFRLSSLIWVPLKINFMDSVNAIRLQYEISLNKMYLKAEEFALKIKRGLSMIPGYDIDLRAAQENFNLNVSLVAEKQQELVDILAGKNMAKAGDEIRAQLGKISSDFDGFKNALSNAGASIRSTLKVITDTTEFQSYREALNEILFAGTVEAMDANNAALAADLEHKKWIKWLEYLNNKEVNDQIIANDKLTTKQRLKVSQDWSSAAVNLMDGFNTLAEGKNRQIFEALKVARVAQAIINAYSGISQVIGDPLIHPYAKPAAIAAISAIGFAQVAAISKTTFGSSSSGQSAGAVNLSGGSAGGTTTATEAVGSTIAPDSEQAPQNITIEIKDLFGQEDVDRFIESTVIPGIERAGERDVNVVVTRNT